MKTHVTLVAAFNIGFGFLGVFIAIIVFVVLFGAGIISGDPEAFAITSTVGTAVSSFLIVLSIPSIIGGFGLLRYRPWARILVIIVACLNLINIPFGTALGIYELWVLLHEKTAQLFYPESSTRAT
jgi:hypothetical protein